MPHAPSIRRSLHEPLLFLRLRMMRLLQVAPSLRQVALELLLLRLENEEKNEFPWESNMQQWSIRVNRVMSGDFTCDEW